MNKTQSSGNFIKISFKQAKKSVSQMKLINGFLFDSTLENEEEAKIVAGNILKAIFYRDFTVASVISQKNLQPIDTQYHGIRLDVQITAAIDGGTPSVTIYDMEMEDRPADKQFLPKRIRFYNALHDAKKLEASEDYDRLPDFVSIVISSYDPFGANDMYYNAKTILTTHPDIPYENGAQYIFLYCYGKPNFDAPDSRIKLSPEHSKKLKKMLRYIVSGEKPSLPDIDIEEIDKIVTRVKSRKEVTKAFMRQWDREMSIKRETKREDALEIIRFGREDGVDDDKTRSRLRNRFMLNEDTINELFAEVDSESLIKQ